MPAFLLQKNTHNYECFFEVPILIRALGKSYRDWLNGRGCSTATALFAGWGDGTNRGNLDHHPRAAASSAGVGAALRRLGAGRCDLLLHGDRGGLAVEARRSPVEGKLLRAVQRARPALSAVTAHM